MPNGSRLKNEKIKSINGKVMIHAQWSLEEEIKHRAQMVSYRILSVIEKRCAVMGLSKKELAEKIGTSPSYITQLYRGTKQVNMTFMGKVEVALGISFTIN